MGDFDAIIGDIERALATPRILPAWLRCFLIEQVDLDDDPDWRHYQALDDALRAAWRCDAQRAAAEIPARVRACIARLPAPGYLPLRRDVSWSDVDASPWLEHLPELYVVRSTSLERLAEQVAARPEAIHGLWPTVNAATIRALAALDPIPRLKHLALTNGRLRQKSAAVLAGAAILRGLEFLSLSTCQLKRDTLGALLASPHLPQLTGFDVAHNRIGRGGFEDLMGAAALHDVQYLDVSSCGLTSIEPLTRAPHMHRLRWLSVAGNRTSVFDALARSAHVRRLEYLDASFTRVKGNDPEVFLTSGNAAHLRGLKLTSLGRDTLAALADAPCTATLDRLDLKGVRLRDRDAAQLAAVPFTSLRILNLRECNLTPKGIETLAAAPWFGGVCSFELSHNNVGDAGLEAIAAVEGPPWHQLQAEGAEIGDRGFAAFVQSPRAAGLYFMNLQSNPISSKGLSALARATHVTGLTALYAEKSFSTRNAPHLADTYM